MWQRTGPAALAYCGLSQQVMYRTTSRVFDVRKLVLPLATLVSNTLRGTLKNSLQQGDRPGHMAKEDLIISFDCCK